MSTTPAIPALPSIERRFTSGRVERRAAADASTPSRAVRGYAAVYNSPSDNLGGECYRFIETIAPGAFDDVLNDDVRALFNHDANLILARSKGGNGTLKIGTDGDGLWYEFEAPATRAGDDLLVSLDRGDVDQSSFGFTVASDAQEWRETTKDGITTVERLIRKVSKLYDVSPVTYPAYADTSVAKRSFEASKQTPATPISETPAPADDSNQFQITGAQAARLGLALQP